MDPTIAMLLASALSFLTAFGMSYAAYHWPMGRTQADDRVRELKARRKRKPEQIDDDFDDEE